MYHGISLSHLRLYSQVEAISRKRERMRAHLNALICDNGSRFLRIRRNTSKSKLQAASTSLFEWLSSKSQWTNTIKHVFDSFCHVFCTLKNRSWSRGWQQLIQRERGVEDRLHRDLTCQVRSGIPSKSSKIDISQAEIETYYCRVFRFQLYKWWKHVKREDIRNICRSCESQAIICWCRLLQASNRPSSKPSCAADAKIDPAVSANSIGSLAIG